MENAAISLIIDDNSNKISFTGLKRMVEIGFASDVDFTELVSTLAEQIDEPKEFTLTIPEYDSGNGKVKIVVETIEEIFKKYNQNIRPNEIAAVDSNDDLPF
jgi:hypothetical protein